MNNQAELAKSIIVAEFVIIFIFGMVDVLTDISWDGYAMIHPNNFINELTNIQALAIAVILFLFIKEYSSGEIEKNPTSEVLSAYSRTILTMFALYFTFFAINEQFEINKFIDPLFSPLPHHILNTIFEWSWTNLLLSLTITFLIVLALVKNPCPSHQRTYLLYGAFWQFTAFFCFLIRPDADEEPQPITLIAYAKETSELLSTFFYLLFFFLVFFARKRFLRE